MPLYIDISILCNGFGILANIPLTMMKYVGCSLSLLSSSSSMYVLLARKEMMIHNYVGVKYYCIIPMVFAQFTVHKFLYFLR